MEEVMVEAIWAIVPSILVGIVLAAWNKREKLRQEKDQEKERTKKEIDVRRVDLELANAVLVREVAMAIKRGSTNGEMNEALKQHEEALENFRKVERKQMAFGGIE